MFTREEASKIKEKFWKTFGQYMSPIPSADGRVKGMNWINYKTGIKGIQFKMDVHHQAASIALTVIDKDGTVRALLWDRVLEARKLLMESIGDNWEWYDDAMNEWGQALMKVEMELPGVSIYKESDWPQIISFLKTHIIQLDDFWVNYGFLFDEYKYLS